MDNNNNLNMNILSFLACINTCKNYGNFEAANSLFAILVAEHQSELTFQLEIEYEENTVSHLLDPEGKGYYDLVVVSYAGISTCIPLPLLSEGFIDELFLVLMEQTTTRLSHNREGLAISQIAKAASILRSSETDKAVALAATALSKHWEILVSQDDIAHFGRAEFVDYVTRNHLVQIPLTVITVKNEVCEVYKDFVVLGDTQLNYK